MEKANRKKEKWMLYGAYGYTGKLIVEEALKNGHHPVLAGRDPEKLKIISEDFGLPHRTFSLEEPNEIKKNLAGIDLVLNAAGPFKYTAEPLIKACLENKAHYLDITGEISVFERNYHYSEQAQDKKVAIISGVGFDIVPSDCLIKYASNQIEQPNNLELGILALSSYSPGTLKTMVDTIHKGSYIRKDGKLLRIKYGNKCKKIKFSKGTKTLCAVPWGDLSTAFHSSRIPNIKCYLPLPKKIRRLLSNFGKLIQKLFSWNLVQKWVKKWIDKHIEGPNKKMRKEGRSELWCRVSNKKGEEFQAWLQTGEAYRLTVLTSIKAVESVFRKKIWGVLTPTEAFGDDFVLQIPGTKRVRDLENINA